VWQKYRQKQSTGWAQSQEHQRLLQVRDKLGHLFSDSQGLGWFDLVLLVLRELALQSGVHLHYATFLLLFRIEWSLP
jgi:hypothetical protein